MVSAQRSSAWRVVPRHERHACPRPTAVAVARDWSWRSRGCNQVRGYWSHGYSRDLTRVACDLDLGDRSCPLSSGRVGQLVVCSNQYAALLLPCPRLPITQIHSNPFRAQELHPFYERVVVVRGTGSSSTAASGCWSSRVAEDCRPKTGCECAWQHKSARQIMWRAQHPSHGKRRAYPVPRLPCPAISRLIKPATLPIGPQPGHIRTSRAPARERSLARTRTHSARTPAQSAPQSAQTSARSYYSGSPPPAPS